MKKQLRVGMPRSVTLMLFTTLLSAQGFMINCLNYEANTFVCDGCPNICEIVNLSIDGELLARWGGRCGKWENIEAEPDRILN